MQQGKQDKFEEMKDRTENMTKGDTKELMQKALKSVKSGRELRKHFTRGGARDGAGRPKKEKSERASNQVNFRITDSQLARLSQLAKEGESTNQVARRMLLGLL